MGPIEIAEISRLLQLLGKSEALKPEVSNACQQAALLLKEMRQLIMGSKSEDPAIKQLKYLLAQLGEG